ncbi:MAG: hypothetical protein AB7G37_04185 [Solirubrobacteraceae bacterium]
MSADVKTKKKCCKSSPRCKRCPVVWKRLESEGLAKREDKLVYRPSKRLKKKDLKHARR